MATSAVGPVTQRIFNLRLRFLGLFAAIVVITNLGYALWVNSGAQVPHGPFLRNLAYVQTALAVVALVFVLRRQRLWAARVLMVGLYLIPSAVAIVLDVSPVIAYTSSVILILVSTVGGDPRETLIATVLVTVTAVPIGWQADLTFERLAFETLPVCITLFAVGSTLGMLQFRLEQFVPQLESAYQHSQRLSHVDDLTGLGNRRQFSQSISQALLLASAENPVALALLDIDHLKAINDRINHPAGDAALRIVAGILSDSIRDRDIACRIGGDEFAVVLLHGGIKGAQQIKDRVYRRLEGTTFDELPGINLRVTVGLTETTDPRSKLEDLLSQADEQLYAERRERR